MLSAIYLGFQTAAFVFPLGGIQMLQSENPNIWQTTLTLAPNSNYTYKFRNGHFPNSWQGGWENVEDNCGFGEHNNRLITVNSTDTVLALYLYY